MLQPGPHSIGSGIATNSVGWAVLRTLHPDGDHLAAVQAGSEHRVKIQCHVCGVSQLYWIQNSLATVGSTGPIRGTEFKPSNRVTALDPQVNRLSLPTVGRGCFQHDRSLGSGSDPVAHSLDALPENFGTVFFG